MQTAPYEVTTRLNSFHDHFDRSLDPFLVRPKTLTKLKIFTHHLGEFHKRLPKIIVDNEHDVMVINNPDDDLQSILGYLTGGYR